MKVTITLAVSDHPGDTQTSVVVNEDGQTQTYFVDDIGHWFIKLYGKVVDAPERVVPLLDSLCITASEFLV